MTLHDFDDHITPYQLRKGQDYYDRQKVTALQQKVAGRWTAIVKGREPYEVVIHIDGGDIDEVSCDCIAHTDDEYCKHVIAVLLALRELTKKGTYKRDLHLTQAEKTEVAEQKALDLLSKKEYRASLDIIRDMIGMMPQAKDIPKYEDINPDLLNHVCTGFDLLVKIVQEPLPQEMLDRIYQRGLEAAREKRYDLSHCDPQWIDALVAMSKGREKQVMDVVDQLLKDKENQEHEDVISRLAKLKTQLLRKLGRGGEVHALAGEYPMARGFRDMLIRECADAGNFTEAKRLAEEGMSALARGHHAYRSHFQETIHNLSLQSGNKQEIRESSMKYFNEQEDMKHYRQFKETYEPGEWPVALKEQIIDPLWLKIRNNVYYSPVGPGRRRGYAHVLANVYKEEQDWQGLIQLVTEYESYYMAEEYCEKLAPMFPAEMVALYYKLILDYAAQYKHLDAITQTVKLLKKVKSWKGGKTMVTKLVTELKTKYPTRLKLIEALQKV